MLVGTRRSDPGRLLLFWKCRTRYVGKRNSGYRYLSPKHPDQNARRHFQGLVKRTFINRINDLFKQPAWRELYVEDLRLVRDADEEKALLREQVESAQVSPEDMTVMVLLQNAPAEFKQLFQILIEDAFGAVRRYRCGQWRRQAHRYRRDAQGGRCETTNQYFARLLGIPPERDLQGEIERYFLQT